MSNEKTKNDKGWVLVTGGSRGIGKGLVEHLCRRGYDVAFTYQSSESAARTLEATLREQGLRCEAVRCDGSNHDQVKECSEELIGRKGSPYGLINNMGITRDATLLNLEPEQWRSVLDTNLDSAFYFVRNLARAMLSKKDGVILQMSSVTGLKGLAGQTHYAASKAGMIGFTRSLALELARFGIRVNAVAPGFIETEMLEQLPEAKRESLARMIPLRRVGTVADVAGLVEFLLSPQATYITGQTLVVDGGLLA